jgi:predicted nucleic acid-binding Zn ribbon protein
MQRKNTQTIGEVLKEYIDSMSIGRKLKESRIEDQWEDLLGKNAASLTRKLVIKNKVLYVYLSSPALRNELLMMREKIIQRINEEAGEELINKIVLK